MEKPLNCILVIFGASGDLTKRKLVPALFELFKQNMLCEGFTVVGVSRTVFSDEDFRSNMIAGVKSYSESKEIDDDLLRKFSRCLHYLSLDPSDSKEFARLREKLISLDDRKLTNGNYLFYLATPPGLYEVIANNLGMYALHKDSNGKSFKRIIIEKPFGYDLDSAVRLNKNVHTIFNESQIYRIDHYLGKETVQNVLALRFSNGIFEPLWNRNYVDRVEITSAESIGVENRGGYYDGSGVLRDMIQNHLLQVTGFIAMEPPSSFDPDAVRNETLKVFQSLRPIEKNWVEKYSIRGQYLESIVKGETLKGYREEKGVAAGSRTETFAAVKFYIDNWRWGGVPFYIRAGKRMPTRVTEVVIHFKETPHHLFTRDNILQSGNQLIIRIQPDEGILLKFGMKTPGSGFKIQTVNMDFHYSDIASIHLPTAYERLLLDCMLGDSTLYARGDSVEACWKFVDPIIQEWRDNPAIKIYGYPAGTWGPIESVNLFDDPQTEWRYPCKNLVDDGLYCEL